MTTKPALLEQHTATERRITFLDLDIFTKGTHVQVREEVDTATVARYAEAYLAGVGMPPIVVFEERAKGADEDDVRYWLADGHHRVAGAKKAELAEINTVVKKGDRRAALLYALSANHQHGLPLTNDDKRRSVGLMLTDSEWRAWSDRAIAEACRVSATLVAKCRAALPADQQTKVRKSKDGRVRNTANIGKAKPAPEPEPDYPGEGEAPTPLPGAHEWRKVNMVTRKDGTDLWKCQGCGQEYVRHGIAWNAPSMGCPKPTTATTQPEHAQDDPPVEAADDEPEELSLDDPGQQSLSAAGVPDLPKTAITVDQSRIGEVITLQRRSLADELDQGKHLWQADHRKLVSVALIVGVPTSEEPLTWSDDLVGTCYTILADRLKAEVIDRLRKPDAHRLPPLIALASWWGIDLRVIEHTAERRASKP